MGLPEFNENGVLPPGIHRATMEEVRERFGGFQADESRPRIMADLENFVAELRNVGIADRVLIDGSFVTTKDRPGDVDIVVEFKPGYDLTSEVRPAEYNVRSPHKVKKKWPLVEPSFYPNGSEALKERITFFSKKKEDTRIPKGLVLVDLT